MSDPFIDEIAVGRACEGDRSVPLTRAEMAEAFRILNDSGLPAWRTGEILGVTGRTVQRWRFGYNAPIGRRGKPVERPVESKVDNL